MASGSLATVGTFAHGEAWEGDPDEEVFTTPTAIFTTAGAWRFHGRHGRVEADGGVVVLGHAGESYRCSHTGRPTDRTVFVSVRGDHELPARASAPRRAALAALVGALCRADTALKVDALALTLLAALHELPDGAPALDARRRAVVSDACEHLERHFDRDVSLAELAAAVHVSPFHLHRVFRAAMGVTPHEYVAQLRVARACDLLREGWSVAETAAAVGYRSSGHFARIFRARTGATPSVYRVLT